MLSLSVNSGFTKDLKKKKNGRGKVTERDKEEDTMGVKPFDSLPHPGALRSHEIMKRRDI